MTPEEVYEELQRLKAEVLTKREFQSIETEKRIEQLKKQSAQLTQLGLCLGIALYAGMIGMFIGSCHPLK